MTNFLLPKHIDDLIVKIPKDNIWTRFLQVHDIIFVVKKKEFCAIKHIQTITNRLYIALATIDFKKNSCIIGQHVSNHVIVDFDGLSSKGSIIILPTNFCEKIVENNILKIIPPNNSELFRLASNYTNYQPISVEDEFDKLKKQIKELKEEISELKRKQNVKT